MEGAFSMPFRLRSVLEVGLDGIGLFYWPIRTWQDHKDHWYAELRCRTRTRPRVPASISDLGAMRHVLCRPGYAHRGILGATPAPRHDSKDYRRRWGTPCRTALAVVKERSIPTRVGNTSHQVSVTALRVDRKGTRDDRICGKYRYRCLRHRSTDLRYLRRRIAITDFSINAVSSKENRSV